MYKIVFSLCLLLSITAYCQSADETAIRQVLDRQTKDWNRGDVAGFMKGYWENDSLMFIGQNGITYGWTNTLNNYKKHYPDTTVMGQLSFNIISVKKLSSDYYHVVGQWFLKRSIGNLNGHYTLLFRKLKNEWVIVCDHSS